MRNNWWNIFWCRDNRKKRNLSPAYCTWKLEQQCHRRIVDLLMLFSKAQTYDNHRGTIQDCTEVVSEFQNELFPTLAGQVDGIGTGINRKKITTLIGNSCLFQCFFFSLCWWFCFIQQLAIIGSILENVTDGVNVLPNQIC